MVGDLLMISNIDQLQEAFKDANDDEKFLIWSKIYKDSVKTNTAEPHTLELSLIEKIIQSDQAILKISLCRFLAHVEEENVIRYIINLFFDKNEVVIENAIKAFDKNHYDGKVNFLLPALNAPNRLAQFFAIEKLTIHGIEESIPILIRLIPSASEALLQKILGGFRFLPDRRAIFDIVPLTEDPRDNIRFQAILAMSALYESGYRKAFKSILHHTEDPYTAIRQAVFWTLRRVPKKENRKYFLKAFEKDPEPLVRQEAVLGLSLYPSKYSISKLIDIYLKEKDRLVQLKAEAVLLAVPLRILKPCFNKFLRKKDSHIRQKIIPLYAYFRQGSKQYAQYLAKQLSQTQKETEKLAIIEAIGIISHKNSTAVLEKNLYNSVLVAYAAMSSLIRINHSEKSFPLLKYLQDSKIPELCQQIALKHYLKIASPQHKPSGIINALIKLLNHPTLNMRYLASQALVKFDEPSAFAPFARSLLNEKDPTASKLLETSLIQFIEKYQEKLLPSMSELINDHKALLQVLALFKKCRLSGKEFLSLWPKLAETPLDLLKSNADEQEALVNIAFPLIKNQIILYNDLVQSLASQDSKNKLIRLLHRKLKKEKDFHFPIHFIPPKDWGIEEELLSDRILILGYSNNNLQIKQLVRIICHTKHESNRKAAQIALNHITEHLPGENAA